MQGPLNKAIDYLFKEDDVIRLLVEPLYDEVVQLKNELEMHRAQLAKVASVSTEKPSFVHEEVANLMVDVDVIRTQEASGAAVAALSVEVPHLEAYVGVRKVHDIENSLFGLESYFDMLGILGDDARLHTVLLYLKNSALIW